ncbi:carbohydrate-binding protein [Streptacidiphilus sp. ASG 303]|uniref:carbohydrate-binding protein n=1 Tax=Streptacidiphilus sp. ASG 303 TaxID=2896847 RepID=UPI001E4DDFEF|nr:carbohydrate-binding protein [Streptacidiphilus sp. ASG 303]MCD0485711.1 carbohydrate-binding protein [Streptacidiphilus sp. ASG 303]
MTAGSNGVPEDDDPFAYLYRPAGGGGAGQEGVAANAATAVQQPGVPRTSYAHPTQVGRTQYGQRPPQQPAYGQTVPPQHTPYAQHSRPQPGGDGHGGRAAARGGAGGRSRAVLLGAVAVAAAVAVGVTVAFMGGDDKDAKAGPATQVSPSTASSAPASPSGPASPAASTDPVVDASALQVQNGGQASDVKGAKSSDRKYVVLQQGTTLTWTLQAPADGPQSLWVHYSNAAGDAQAAVTVNGRPHTGGIGLRNYAHQKDAAHSWVSSYVYPDLQPGANTVVITCDNPACAGILVDRVALTPRSVQKFPG